MNKTDSTQTSAFKVPGSMFQVGVITRITLLEYLRSKRFLILLWCGDPSRIETPEATAFWGREEESSKTMPYRSKWTPEDKIRIVMESLDTSISLSEAVPEVQPDSGHVLPVEGEVRRGRKARPVFSEEQHA